MKTYHQILEHLSEKAFKKYMAGSNNLTQDLGLSSISYIYNIPEIQIEQDIIEQLVLKRGKINAKILK